jgi:predicted nucleic acid binding AN1-type Zn finger protein
MKTSKWVENKIFTPDFVGQTESFCTNDASYGEERCSKQCDECKNYYK